MGDSYMVIVQWQPRVLKNMMHNIKVKIRLFYIWLEMFKRKGKNIYNNCGQF